MGLRFVCAYALLVSAVYAMMYAMPRSDDPRVMVRMTPEGFAAVKAAADKAGVSVGGLVRECAERYASAVAAEVRAGSVKIRRASGAERLRAAPKEPTPVPLLDAVAREGEVGKITRPVVPAGADRAAAFRAATSRRP